MVDPDGLRTVQACWPRVKEATYLDAFNDNDIVKGVWFPCQDPQAAMGWARSQVGLRYDLLALLGLLLHRDWSSPRKWECARFAGVALANGGSAPLRKEDLDRATPQHLWMLPNQEV